MCDQRPLRRRRAKVISAWKMQASAGQGNGIEVTGNQGVEAQIVRPWPLVCGLRAAAVHGDPP